MRARGNGHDVVNDQSEAYELYKKWGVPVSPHNREVTSFKEILDMIDYYGEHRGDIEHALGRHRREGRRFGIAAFPWRYIAGAALGHRLQISTGRGQYRAA